MIKQKHLKKISTQAKKRKKTSDSASYTFDESLQPKKGVTHADGSKNKLSSYLKEDKNLISEEKIEKLILDDPYTNNKKNFRIEPQTQLIEDSVDHYVQNDLTDPICVFSLPNFMFNKKSGKKTPLHSCVEQAFLEDSVTMKFCEVIYQKAKFQNESLFVQLDKNVNSQIQKTQKNLDLINDLYKKIDNCNSTLLHTTLQYKESIKNISKNLLEKYSFDPSQVIDGYFLDPNSLVNDYTGKKFSADINNLTSTTLACLLLKVASQSLTSCMTLSTTGRKIIPNKISKQTNLVDNFDSYFDTDIKAISKYSNQNLVHGTIKDETSYGDLDFYPKLLLNIGSYDYSALTLLTMVSNEMSISAGIGRLINTPLGNRFGASTNNVIESFLGVSTLKLSDHETVSQNSLYDYFVISKNGNKRVDGSKEVRVLLNDVKSAGSNYNVTNSYDEFFKSFITNPQGNSFKIYDKALSDCIATYDSGLEYYKKLHLADKKPDLLTPKGLFTRVLKDLSKSIENLSLPSNFSNKELATEIAFLKTLSSTQEYLSDTSSGKLRSFVLGAIVRKSAQMLSNKTFNTKENQQTEKTDKNVTSVKITKQGSTKPSDEFTVETVNQKASSNEKYTPGENVIRFANDSIESSLTNFGYLSSVDETLADALKSLSLQNGAPRSGNPWVITVHIQDFISNLLTSDTTIISKIAKIFVDLCNEADQFSKCENKESSWLNELRLTRNSKMNGTLLLSMIFESFLYLIQNFADADLLAEGGISKTKINVMINYGNSNNEFRAKSLSLLVNSSENDTIKDIIDKDGMITSLSVSQNSKISNTTSFRTFVDYFSLLSKERLIPLEALMSVRSMLENTQAQTNELKILSKMISGEIKKSDDVQSFLNFAQTSYGNAYLKDISKQNIEISKTKLEDIKKSFVNPSKRLPRINKGIKTSIDSFIDNLSSSSENYVFMSVGIPKNIVEGNSNILNCIINKKNHFDETTNSSIAKQFFSFQIVDDKSFDNVENNNIYDNIELVNSSNELLFVASLAPDALKNEVQSELSKILFSLVSSVCLNEKRITTFDETKTSNSSRDLARIFAKVANLDQYVFDEIFVQVSNQTFINDINLLKLCNKTNITHGAAELFFDLFRTVYFESELIEEKVFSSTLFDKIIVVDINDNTFKVIEDKKKVRPTGLNNYKMRSHTENSKVYFSVDEYNVTIEN
jgi:hypothetical protein